MFKCKILKITKTPKNYTCIHLVRLSKAAASPKKIVRLSNAVSQRKLFNFSKLHPKEIRATIQSCIPRIPPHILLAFATWLQLPESCFPQKSYYSPNNLLVTPRPLPPLDIYILIIFRATYGGLHEVRLVHPVSSRHSCSVVGDGRGGCHLVALGHHGARGRHHRGRHAVNQT